MDLSEENIDVLEREIDSTKKSFFIRDILQQSTESANNHNLDSTDLVPNERIISWILQNRSQFSLNSVPETDFESESIVPMSNEMSKRAMFSQKDPIGMISDSWLSMTSSVPDPLILYQQLYYYALQNQLSTSIASLDNMIDNSQTVNSNIVGTIIKSKEEESIISSPECKQKCTIEAKLSKSRSSNNSSVNGNKTANKINDSNKNEENLSAAATIKTTSKLSHIREKNILALGSCSSSSRNRRNRTVFSELQLMGLERRFDSQKYLSTPDRADLARALGLTQLQVKTWYQNRRMKWKKQVMQNGCPFPPTKPKGRPKKDSIPTYGIEFTNSILCSIFSGNEKLASRKQIQNNIITDQESPSSELIS